MSSKFKLIFFTPPTHLAVCKAAGTIPSSRNPVQPIHSSQSHPNDVLVFAAGAGRYPGAGSYTECAFSTPGVGQFRPGGDAKPAIGTAGKDGQPGEVEEVGEVRVETLCVGENVVRESVAALKGAHPYETPAYEVYRMEDF